MRSKGVGLLFTCYLAALLFHLLDVVGHLFLSIETGFTLGFVGFSATLVLLPGILLWAIWPPRSRSKFGAAGVAILLAVLVFGFDYRPLRHMSDRLFVTVHADELESFVTDAAAYGRIRHMTYSERWPQWLNRTLVMHGEEAEDSSALGSSERLRRYPPLESILARDSIDASRYWEFARRLGGLHFYGMRLEGPNVFLDRVRMSGLAYVPAAGGPIEVGETIPGTGNVITRSLGGDWYYSYCCR